tara:strand:- start:12889 stop:13515 length:627 start_codon:yes stop_codon:yes gene_type:complete
MVNNKIRKHLGKRSERGKLDALHNFHKNSEGVILSCGPSIKKYENEIINLKNVIIIGVKQAIRLAPYLNYHLLNFVNVAKYNYEKPKPIVLETVRVKNKSNADIRFPFRHTKPLSSTLNFSKYEMSKSFTRPWGPGIMYELGFYLAFHLGLNKITTYGWDNDLSNGSRFDKNIKITPSMIRECNEAKKAEDDVLTFFRRKGMEIDIKR